MEQKDFKSIDDRRFNEENPTEEQRKQVELRGEKERNSNLNKR